MRTTTRLADYVEPYRRAFDQMFSDPGLKFVGGQLRTGTIASVAETDGTPVSYWNLDSGQFRTGDGTFSGLVTASTFSGGLFTGTAVYLGDSNIVLDGPNKRILISDGTNNRVLIGYDSGGF